MEPELRVEDEEGPDIRGGRRRSKARQRIPGPRQGEIPGENANCACGYGEQAFPPMREISSTVSPVLGPAQGIPSIFLQLYFRDY